MKYKVFRCGGDPDNDFCLSNKLEQLLNDLQSNGYVVVRIDYHEISRAWSIEGKYKKTSEYIILVSESEGKEISDLKEVYQKGYKDGQEMIAAHLELCKEEKAAILEDIKTIVNNWKTDTWTDNLSCECMQKIAYILEESEDKGHEKIL